MRKFALFSIVAASLSLFADNVTDCGTCTKIPLSAPEYICDQPHPVFYGTLDFTYWVGSNPSLRSFYEYPIQNPGQRGATTHWIAPNFKGRPGFKVGLGGHITETAWDLYAQYTFFYNKNSQPNVPLQTTATDLYGYEAIGCSYYNQFNSISLVLRKNFSSGKRLSVDSFAGLLAGWDTQWFYLNQHFIADLQPFGPTQYGQDAVYKQRWWGMGPYTGFNSKFLLPVGFLTPHGQLGFYLDGGIGLPYSRFSNKIGSVWFPTEEEWADGGVGTYDDYFSFWFFSPMLESSIGCQWQTLYGKENKNIFSLKMGVEQQFWYKHSYLNRTTFANLYQSSSADNMLLQGLTIRGQFEY